MRKNGLATLIVLFVSLLSNRCFLSKSFMAEINSSMLPAVMESSL